MYLYIYRHAEYTVHQSSNFTITLGVLIILVFMVSFHPSLLKILWQLSGKVS